MRSSTQASRLIAFDKIWNLKDPIPLWNERSNHQAFKKKKKCMIHINRWWILISLLSRDKWNFLSNKVLSRLAMSTLKWNWYRCLRCLLATECNRALLQFMNNNSIASSMLLIYRRILLKVKIQQENIKRNFWLIIVNLLKKKQGNYAIHLLTSHKTARIIEVIEVASIFARKIFQHCQRDDDHLLKRSTMILIFSESFHLRFPIIAVLCGFKKSYNVFQRPFRYERIVNNIIWRSDSYWIT